MFPRRAPLLALAAAAALTLLAPRLPPVRPPLAATLSPALEPPRFTRDQMEAALEQDPRFLFVYGTQQPSASAALRARALLMARRLFDRDSSAVLADRDARPESLAARSIVLLGTPAENLWTRSLASALPVTFTPQGFRWQGRDYDRPGDAMHLVFPNPLAPRRFLLLIAANANAAVSGHAGFFFGGEDWRIERNGELARSGSFAQSAAGPWRYDPALDRDFERERDEFHRSLIQHEAPGVRLEAPPGVAFAPRAARSAGELLERLDRTGLRAPHARQVHVVAYASLVQKGELAHNTRPEHLEADGSAALALPAGRSEPDLWSVAAARMLALGASPASPYLEATGVWLAMRFEGEPLEDAIARLYFARLLPTASEAAVAGTAWRSRLLRVPAQALLARAIFECAGRRGTAALSALLAASPPGTLDSLCRRAGVDFASTTRRYATLADSLARRGRAEVTARAPDTWRPADGFQRGVCLAHSVGLEQGYLSSSAAHELAAVRALGANWVSLTPVGELAGSRSPGIVPSADGGVDEETDEAVCEAAARAHALGLHVMLTPQLWTRGGAGAVDLSASEWPRFFEQYRTFLLHYAVLAQRERMDALVVGHELTNASLAFPDRWRALIGEVRRVYSGSITYGASWDREAEGIAFWDACDLIGVSFFRPLSDRSGASQEAMTEAARKALEPLHALAIRAHRPVVLTEAGYAATADGAVRPGEEPRGAAVDPEAQRRAFAALLRAMQDEDWLAGVYVWRWPSGGDAGGRGDQSFSPRGRPAQALIGSAFEAWGRRAVVVPAELDRDAPRAH
jgi:hypothetical protein